MKAVLMTDTGSPDVLKITEVEEPRILEPRQIKVKLKAAGVNPIDTKLRKGGLFYDNALPAILGCDGAGVVEEVGPGATRFQPGDNVWFCHGGLGKEPGNYAQYTVLDERWAAPLPSSVSFEEAAAAPLVLITAWGALYERGGLLPGQTVLIHAGAGGVGHVAIQLAKLRGARVITTVSTEEKGEFVRRLGADEVIFYQRENFADHVNRMTGGEGANLVFDTVGPEVFVSSIVATAHFGSLVTLLNPGRIDLQEARMRNLKIGFELMLTPMLRNLDAARDKHVKIL
ncbi:MAG: zinc-dependent alcohol dehydrogenase family protein, partial [Gammaproteobacteria bacterium]